MKLFLTLSVTLAVGAVACNAPSDDGLYEGSGGAGVFSASESSTGSEAGASTAVSSNRDAGGSATGGSNPPMPAMRGTGGALPPTALDAGVVDASLDAGRNASGQLLTPDATSDRPDAAAPLCSGVAVDSLCWHLGVAGANCSTTCAAHGGFDSRGLASVGSESQGGSRNRCQAIINILIPTITDTVNQATRGDGIGLGCHAFDDPQPLWWLNDVEFSENAPLVGAEIACPCLQ